MPCPASGQISIADLVAEFGGTAPHALSEYYRNAGLVPANNTNVPTSGECGLTNFYSAVNEIQHTHSSNTTNQNYATVFGSNWGTAVPKRIIINSGVTIGATAGNHAMHIPSGMGGTLIIDNNGSIEGYGGGSNGGTGGNAIHCDSTAVTINNNSGAAIKAGGGGGGQGGTGGTGGNGGTGGTGGQGQNTTYIGRAPYYCYVQEWSNYSHTQQQLLQQCRSGYRTGWGHTQFISNVQWSGYGYQSRCWYADCNYYTYTNGGAGGAGGSSGGAGGAGGAGGVGQGYNQSNTSGSSGAAGSSGGSGSGGAGGGTNAGSGGTGGARGQGGQGGTGGTGGTFGNAGGNGGQGSTGATGASGNSGGNGNYTNGSGGSSGSGGSAGSAGQSGGAAGYYIYNRSSITLNNSGTVAGN